MTETDRTRELLQAMLERRADRPPPAWLLDRTMQQVAGAYQVRRGSRWRVVIPERRGARLAMLGALAVVGVLAGGALAAGGLFDRTVAPEPTQPAVVVSPTGSPSPAVGPSEATTSASSSPSPTATPRPVPTALAAGVMAVVTGEGDRLRVRTAPGVGSDSEKLEPLQAAGTRMLIVDGPVAKDGYDWYEVRTEGNPLPLYGWVAAGKDGKAWILPTAPTCGDGLDAKAVVSLDAIDYLLCYGDAPVELKVTAVEPQPGTDEWCPWTREPVHCAIDPAWMNAQVWLVVDAGEDTSGGVGAVVPPELAAAVNALTDTGDVMFTVAADTADARSCRIVDAEGRDLAPRAQAVLECRLLFVVRDVARYGAGVPPDAIAGVGATSP